MLKSKIDFNRVKKIVIDGRQDKLIKDAPNIIHEIQERTRSSKDVNNKSFNHYTKEYAKQKGTSRNKVTLTLKNHMLANITWKNITNGIRIYFASVQENKKAHGNQVKNGRKFLGVDPRQKKRIESRLKKL